MHSSFRFHLKNIEVCSLLPNPIKNLKNNVKNLYLNNSEGKK